MQEQSLSISIVIPTFNGIGNLPHVLNGIERQTLVKRVNQIIIVDDASTFSRKKDRYAKLLSEYPRLPVEVVYLEKNGGPAIARNAGIRQTTGDIVFFTDDDCELPANALELHMDVYRDKSYISGVGGWYQSLSHVIHKSTVERFIFLRYIIFFGLDMYRSIRVSSDYSPSSSLFIANNTANFSVRQCVLNDVQFDEDFIAPGSEDVFFSEEIRRRGYLLEYIPFFVSHRKNLTLKTFWKHCYNRGMGTFVYRKKYGRKPQMNLLSDLVKFNNTAIKLSKKYPALARRRYRIIVLHAIRILFSSSWLIDKVYFVRYFLRRGYIPIQKY